MATADVLIIGAGAAGLTAGQALEGVLSNRILEDNSVLGGRLKKLEGFADYPIDVGGEWIQADQCEILTNIAGSDPSENTVPYTPSFFEWDGSSFQSSTYKGDSMCNGAAANSILCGTPSRTTCFSHTATVQVLDPMSGMPIATPMEDLRIGDFVLVDADPVGAADSGASDMYEPFVDGIKEFLDFSTNFYNEAFDVFAYNEPVDVSRRGNVSTTMTEQVLIPVTGTSIATPLVDVRIADSILVHGDCDSSDELDSGDGGYSGKYELVYAFAHWNPTKEAEYLQIEMNHTSEPLEISRDHLVFVQGKAHPVRADSLGLGDILRTASNESTSMGVNVTGVGVARKMGLYAPLTRSGHIIANGVQAGTYTSLQPGTDFVQFGEWTTGLSQHDLIHMALSPYRLICGSKASSNATAICNELNEEGMPYYVDQGLQLAQCANQLVWLEQILLFGVILSIVLPFWAAESYPWVAILFLQVLCLWCGLVGARKVWGLTKKKQPGKDATKKTQPKKLAESQQQREPTTVQLVEVESQTTEEEESMLGYEEPMLSGDRWETCEIIEELTLLEKEVHHPPQQEGSSSMPVKAHDSDSKGTVSSSSSRPCSSKQRHPKTKTQYLEKGEPQQTSAKPPPVASIEVKTPQTK